MIGMLRRFLFAVLVLTASGCATAPPWERFAAGGAVESPQKGFSFQAPEGWRRAPGEAGDRVLLTLDGLAIQQLVLGRATRDKAFALTKAKPAADISLRELGELFLAEIRMGNKESSVALKSSGETRIDGRPAFLLHLSERTPRGAQYERIVAGLQGEAAIFWASCRALSRHFFEQARPVCERTLSTVRLAPL